MMVSTSLHHLLASFFQVLQNPSFSFTKYIILALMVGVEGPIATLIGAAAAGGGYMQPDLVFLSASVGNLGADTVWYSIGYAGRIDWLLQIGQKIGIKQLDVNRLRAGMRKHATKILLVAKITSGLIIPSLIAAGLARVPWKRWFPPVALGEFIWTGSLVLIGYYAAHSITQVQQDIRLFVIASTSILFVGLIWLVRRALQKRGSDVDKLISDD